MSNEQEKRRLVWVVQSEKWCSMPAEKNTKPSIEERISGMTPGVIGLGVDVPVSPHDAIALAKGGLIYGFEDKGQEFWIVDPFKESQPTKEKPMSEQQQPSLGGQFDAWIRQGAKDLHNAIVPAFPESARSQDEPGTPLNPTPHMVTSDLGMGSYEKFVDQKAAKEPEVSQEQEKER